MPPVYGTLQILDTLGAANNQNVIQFGEENLAGFLQQLLDAHNRLVGDIFGTFVGFTNERLTAYGTGMTAGQMVDVDEYGVADAQKIPFTQDTVGFPLRRKQYSLQWTGDYLAKARPIELATQLLSATDADLLAIYSAIRTALFNPSNNTTYRDRFVDSATYTIKALINADGSSLPPQPITGNTFNGGTHTHYLATASLTEADYLAAVETIREHGFVGNGRIIAAIPKSKEAAVRAFSGFNAYTDARIIYGTNANRADQTVDLMQLEDRAIGFDGVAEIWVKPWVPDNYLCFYVEGGVGEPVLGFRTPQAGPVNPAGGLATPAPNPVLAGGAPVGAGDFGALRIVADFDRFPLHARVMQRDFGIAVWNRLNAAILYTGGGTYTAPTGL